MENENDNPENGKASTETETPIQQASTTEGNKIFKYLKCLRFNYFFLQL